MKLELIKGSENYTAQVIKLPVMKEVKGLDNLVEVNYQGNSCLVGKDSNKDSMYIFFPCECELSKEFLSNNNLYRHLELNVNKELSGFFDDSGRVKAIKFKGVVSSGFICPIDFLEYTNTKIKGIGWDNYSIGDEFNSIDGNIICKKYITKKQYSKKGNQLRDSKLLDSIIDSKMAPEHMDTSHLLKNLHKLSLDDYIAITYKLHGTSARVYHTLTKKQHNWFSKLVNKLGVSIQQEEYSYIVGSRKVIKSRNFNALDNKNHYYKEDLWTKVCKEQFEGKLIHGEAIYFEIIGKTYDGGEIQGGYSYGFESPKCYIYRISNINSKGVEIDLSYLQMKERALQLGVDVCPEYFYGELRDFLNQIIKKKWDYIKVMDDLYLKTNMGAVLNEGFYNNILEQPSILDNSVVEEGFCLRIDKYPKPEIFKIKSKKFLLHESKLLDKEVIDIETEETINEDN